MATCIVHASREGFVPREVGMKSCHNFNDLRQSNTLLQVGYCSLVVLAGVGSGLAGAIGSGAGAEARGDTIVTEGPAR